MKGTTGKLSRTPLRLHSSPYFLHLAAIDRINWGLSALLTVGHNWLEVGASRYFSQIR